MDTTIATLLKWATDQLDVQSDSARLDAELLLSHALKRPRSHLYAWPESTVTVEVRRVFEGFMERRLDGVPIAYILGEREFWGLPLKVNEQTLIPRPETELLVEASLAQYGQQKIRVADLGTGSGAIALALSSERPAWDIFAIDRSREALKIARQNAQRLKLRRVCFIQADWADALKPELWDLLVSNPPYIDPADPHLARSDVRYEPRSALVAGNHGLADISCLVQQAGKVLKSGGTLLLEHGYQQGQAVRGLLESANFVNVRTLRDLSGRDRVTQGLQR